MDDEGYVYIFGPAEWPDGPFWVHVFVADVQLVEDDQLVLLLEVLSTDQSMVRPAVLRADPFRAMEVFGGEQPAQLEGRWRTLQLQRGHQGELTVSILASFADVEGVAYGVLAFNATPNPVVDAYSQPVGTPASAGDIRAFLAQAVGERPIRLAVLDVGQGAAAFLYHANGDGCVRPALYLDIGGGCGPNKGTFPQAGLRWCFCGQPGILLSHWHWDHWVGATYGDRANVAGPLAATWLVPSKPPGPKAKAFAATIINAGGTVMHWDGRLQSVKCGRLTLAQGTGHSWNDSGLALLASLDGGGLALAPGDAAYAEIAQLSLPPEGLQTLVISHHGGSAGAALTRHVPRPRAGVQCYAYCSVGDGNTYKHPTNIQAHSGVGWSVVRTDARLRTNPRPKHYDAATGGTIGGQIGPCCAGAHCSLVLDT